MLGIEGAIAENVRPQADGITRLERLQIVVFKQRDRTLHDVSTLSLVIRLAKPSPSAGTAVVLPKHGVGRLPINLHA